MRISYQLGACEDPDFCYMLTDRGISMEIAKTCFAVANPISAAGLTIFAVTWTLRDREDLSLRPPNCSA